MEKPKAKRKMGVAHIHLLKIERAVFDDKTGVVSGIDLYCEGCGRSFYARDPSTHKGDMAERNVTVHDL